ncbi:hypothetical protein RRG08_002069 [Elysia crispata]|uniref:Uncharacterized protein n=1 Tax=Elysia crispata TaxID=231223 RepID=A0AAE0ZKI2_9GAST|nr:hypothetical protein RRG08_002069 [Elysia crispata]
MNVLCLLWCRCEAIVGTLEVRNWFDGFCGSDIATERVMSVDRLQRLMGSVGNFEDFITTPAAHVAYNATISKDPITVKEIKFLTAMPKL